MRSASSTLNLEGATLHEALQLEASPGLSDAVLQGMLADACTQEILRALTAIFSRPGRDAQGLRASLLESPFSRNRALLGTFDYVVAGCGRAVDCGPGCARRAIRWCCSSAGSRERGRPTI